MEKDYCGSHEQLIKHIKDPSLLMMSTMSTYALAFLADTKTQFEDLGEEKERERERDRETDRRTDRWMDGMRLMDG